MIRQHKYNQYSDEELIASYKRDQNKVIIGEIYKRYGHLVFGVCLKILNNKLDSEDTTMRIFQTLGEKLMKYEIHYLKSWLYQVSQNECFMILRKLSKVREVEFNDQQNETSDDQGTDDAANECFENNLFNAIEMLKEDQRLAIELFYKQEKSYLEISNEMGWELKKVKSYIQNAKRNLKLTLQNICNEK